MRTSSVVQLGLLAVASVLTACGDCEAVQHSSGQADTVEIERTNGDCTVHAYAADSVGPKPKK
jgi:hypothetical protein